VEAADLRARLDACVASEEEITHPVAADPFDAALGPAGCK
jgi:hypothetical protein